MAIDPRIRARRVEVHRAEGRRRLRFVAVAAGLVAVAVAAWGLTRTPLLDLDHVRVDGAEDADIDVVLDHAALVPGTAMFDLDLGAAERAVAELAWIKSVRAEREWPGSVRLTVVPRTGVAVLADDTNAFVVDEEGVVIGPADDGTDLPAVRWTTAAEPGEAEREALPAIAVARAIPDDLRPWVELVTVDADGLGLDLIGSATVRLGDGGLMEDKLSAVRSVLQNVDLECLDFIDVTAADLTTGLRDDACDAANAGEPADDTP
ncbi:MAG: hypothetical protein DHS20C19_22130 [Acidimicrobiales bacterium]|nr:MAG: hypothetical protein DHS20C19_22130 [Acidimicrobiales bacterium]